jgi:hypothetical protein
VNNCTSDINRAWLDCADAWTACTGKGGPTICDCYRPYYECMNTPGALGVQHVRWRIDLSRDLPKSAGYSACMPSWRISKSAVGINCGVHKCPDCAELADQTSVRGATAVTTAAASGMATTQLNGNGNAANATLSSSTGSGTPSTSSAPARTTFLLVLLAVIGASLL